MGYIYEPTIRDAAAYLLSILQEKTEVAFAAFYDGTDEAAERVHRGVGIDWATPEEGVALHALELAISQLEGQGLLTTHPLGEKLADGEPDYGICLTDKGRTWFREKFELRFGAAE